MDRHYSWTYCDAVSAACRTGNEKIENPINRLLSQWALIGRSIIFFFFSTLSSTSLGYHISRGRLTFLSILTSPPVGYDKVKGAGLNSKSGPEISSLVEKRLFIVCFRVDRRELLSSWLLGSTGFTIRMLLPLSIGFMSSPVEMNVGLKPRS